MLALLIQQKNIATLIVFSVIVSLCLACSEQEFQCANDQCIHRSGYCNGTIECNDRSDESYESCSNLECPKHAFRCAYGACIAADLKCNRHPDCADTSDENQVICANEQQLRDFWRHLKGTCSIAYSMQCAEKCLESNYICDGVADCADGSDETLELCVGLECPSYAARCNYGACINPRAYCDGKIDCVDGSDELHAICGKQKFNLPATDTNSANCILPANVPQLVIRNYLTRAIYTHGDKVPAGTLVHFNCTVSHRLVGAEFNACYNGVWLAPLPKCTSHSKRSR